jgi:hypothetical protein
MACKMGPTETLDDDHPLVVEYNEDDWKFCVVMCGAAVSTLGTRAYVYDVTVEPPILCEVKRMERLALRDERGDADGAAAEGGALGKRLRKATDALALSSMFHMPHLAMAMDLWPRFDLARAFRFADQSNLGNIGAPELVSSSLADHDEPGKELVLSPPRRMGAYSAVIVQLVEAIISTQHMAAAGVARRGPDPAGVAPAVIPAPLGPVAPAAGAARGGGRGAAGGRGRGAPGAAPGALAAARMAAARHAEGSIGLWEAVSAPASVQRWSGVEALEATRGLITISKALRMLSAIRWRTRIGVEFLKYDIRVYREKITQGPRCEDTRQAPYKTLRPLLGAPFPVSLMRTTGQTFFVRKAGSSTMLCNCLNCPVFLQKKNRRVQGFVRHQMCSLSSCSYFCQLANGDISFFFQV